MDWIIQEFLGKASESGIKSEKKSWSEDQPKGELARLTACQDGFCPL
jgi:hypothetical protein